MPAFPATAGKRSARGRTRRRPFLASLAAGAALGACGRAEPLAGVIAIPERSLTYAPLLLAIKQGLYRDPPLRAAMLLRTGGSGAAAAVAGGEADAAALALPDFLDAVEAGRPLVAIGALTRRFAGQLVVSGARPLERNLDALLGGRWRGTPLGTQTGGDGTEHFLRALWLTRGARVASGADSALLSADGLAGEPRYLGFQTGEALVAALRDNRIAGYVGHAMASVQSTLLGENVVVANFSAGAGAPEAGVAHCTVLVAHREKVVGGPTAPLLGALVAACVRAAQALVGPDAVTAAQRALPDFDPLHLSLAMQLDSPSPDASVYAMDGRLPADALPALAELRARAGRPTSLNQTNLTAAIG